MFRHQCIAHGFDNAGYSRCEFISCRIVDPIQKSGHIAVCESSDARHDLRVDQRALLLVSDVAHTLVTKFDYAFSIYLAPKILARLPVFRWDYLMESLVELVEFGKNQH